MLQDPSSEVTFIPDSVSQLITSSVRQKVDSSHCTENHHRRTCVLAVVSSLIMHQDACTCRVSMTPEHAQNVQGKGEL